MEESYFVILGETKKKMKDIMTLSLALDELEIKMLGQSTFFRKPDLEQIEGSAPPGTELYLVTESGSVLLTVFRVYYFSQTNQN